MPSQAVKSASAIRNHPEPFPSQRGMWLNMIGLLLLTLLVYIPSYKAGFIWDDEVIAANPVMKEGWRGLRDIWFSIRYGDFVPLTATTFWVEWQLYGGMKEIQHATNIVLHALNVILLWRVLLQLRISNAWVVAAVFAVHPVCVASVTWLAERKNTLSMFFYLLSLLFYLRSENIARSAPVSHPDKRARRFYCLSFVFFLLGLLSKSSVVVLPVVLLLCAWWRDGKIDRRNLMRVMPFFVFAFAVGITTLVAHFYYGPKLGVLPTGDNLLVRMLTAARAFWFYLFKDLLPVGLTMHYPRWTIDPASPMAYVPGLLIIGVIFLFWRFRQSWGKACLFGFGYFILAMGPVIGVINMAFLMTAPVADHFQYLALPGIIALVVGGGIYLTGARAARPRIDNSRNQEPGSNSIPVFLSVLLIAPLTILSWKHQRLVATPEALWRDNLKKHPTSWVSHNNLGGFFSDKGRYQEALHEYQEALKTRSNLSMVHVNVGTMLHALGRTEEAIPRYIEALRLDPTDFKAHNNLGVALITLGRTNEAISSFQKAVELVPGDATFFANLARLLIESGQTQRAIQVFRNRLRRVPGDGAAHYQLGGLFFQENQSDEALFHYEQAVRLTPEFVEARFASAELLARRNKKAEAIEQWREILKRKPDAIQAIANLAWALATDPDDKLRNGSESVALAERACAMEGRNTPAYVDLLAAAYAEAGRFAEAIKTEEEAVSLADAGGQKELAATYRSRVNLYRSGKPFRSY